VLRGHRFTVLLVEDSPDDAELMAHELRLASFDLTWARADTEADYLAHLEKFTGSYPHRL
jgi:DNA-binding response OmpR family regulator